MMMMMVAWQQNLDRISAISVCACLNSFQWKTICILFYKLFKKQKKKMLKMNLYIIYTYIQGHENDIDKICVHKYIIT